MRTWLVMLLVGAAAAVVAFATWPAATDTGSKAHSPSAAREGRASGDGPVLHAGAASPSDEVDDPFPVSVAPLVEKLSSGDKVVRNQAAYALREAIQAGTVPLEELLRLAVASVKAHNVSKRAIDQIERLHLKAAPLLPTLFDWIYADGTEGEHALLGARLIHGITCGKKHRAQARELLRPFFDRASAVILDPDTELLLRVELLHVPEVMGPEAAAIAPALVDWIRQIEGWRAEYEKANPGFMVSYMHVEYDLRRVLSALGPNALPSIVEGMTQDDDYGEFELGRAIEDMGKEALPALTLLVSHEDAGVVAAALVAIANHLDDSAEFLEILRTLAKHPEVEMRVTAVAALGKAGAAAIPELVLALSDPSKRVRREALRSIERVPAAAKEALPELLEIMREDRKAVSALTLGRLGAAAAGAAPAILDEIMSLLANEYMRDRILLDEDYAVRDQVFALREFGPAATRMLVDAAIGKHDKRSEAAIFALHRMAKVDARAIAPLGSKLGDLKGVSRVAAAGLLFDAGQAHGLRVVIEALGDSDAILRATAAKAVERSGIHAKKAWPALLDAIVLHAKAWRSAADSEARINAKYELQAYARALDVVAELELEACLPLLRQSDEDAAQQATRVFAAARGRGLALLRNVWPRLSAPVRAQLVYAFRGVVNAPKNPFAAGRSWVTDQLEDKAPIVRLAAVLTVRGDEHETRVMPVLIELLRHEETVRGAVYWLRQATDRALLPYEEQLRAVPPPQDEIAHSWLRAALERIEAARPSSGG